MSCTLERLPRQARSQRFAAKLPYLAQLGINAIELMPIGEFPADGTGVMILARCMRHHITMERPIACEH